MNKLSIHVTFQKLLKHNFFMRRIFIILAFIIASVIIFVTPLFSDEFYDLCYRTYPLKYGKILFLRYKYPTLDPVLKTYEIHLFDPLTGLLSFLQKYNEKIYITPSISRDKTTICYHSLIEGNDYLVTRNIELGKSTRLRFDTGGYFLLVDIDYDNDTVAAVIKRGEEKQGLYLISNRQSSIKRVFNGESFLDIGFFYNGNVYYIDEKKGEKLLGFISKESMRNTVITGSVEYVKKSPNGDALLYSKRDTLFLFRVYNNESIKISSNFNPEGPLPIFTQDGSTCAVFQKNTIYIVNFPSGDILYYLSIPTDNTKSFITDFTFYISRQNKIYYLKYKKPGQELAELFQSSKEINLLSVSPDDRYIVYLEDNPKTLFIRDITSKKTYSREFTFDIENVIYPIKGESLYLIVRSRDKEKKAFIQELYMYNFEKESMFTISTASNTEIGPYLRNQ